MVFTLWARRCYIGVLCAETDVNKGKIPQRPYICLEDEAYMLNNLVSAYQ